MYKNRSSPKAARFYRLLQAAALALVSLSTPAAAAEDVNPLDLSPEQLFSATVMSVSKTPERLFDAPAAISVLTNEDIKRSGATSIPEALRLVPGVQVERIGTAGWAVGIRGFNSALNNKLLVLIDGREAYDHLFSGVYWDVQDTMLEDIERIEVIRGPGATLWGANAVNGVINIITKSSADTQGGLVSGLIGNQENGTASARYGGAIGNGFYRVYGKYLDRGPETTLAGADARDGWQAWRGGFRSDWTLGGGDRLTVQGDTYNSDTGQFRNISNSTAPPFFTTEVENIDASGANLVTRWNHAVANGGQVQVQAYVDYTLRSQALLKDRRVSADVEAQYDFAPAEKHKVIVGGRYRWSMDDLTQSALLTTVIPRRNDQLFSCFAQDKITLMPEKLFLTVGSKFEHNDFTGFEVEPSARLQWHPDSSKMFWTSISRAVRTPSRLENDLRIVSGVLDVLGPAYPVEVTLIPSPQFNSEELTAYEAGFRSEITPASSLDVAVFFNDYDRLSTLTLQAPIPPPGFPAPGPFILPILTTNDTTGEIYGVETTLNWKARDNLNLTASHSLFDIQLHGPPSTVAIASEIGERQSAQSQINLRAQWDVTPSVSVDTMAYHVSPISAFSVKDYWRLDTRVGWKVTDNVEAAIVGQNLLRSQHREFTSTTDANASYINRSIFGTITWRF